MQFLRHARRRPWLTLLFVNLLLISMFAQMAGAQTLADSPSYLGIRLVELDGERARELNLDPSRGGVEVTLVRSNSPAAVAGLHVGDILLTYNGEPILSGEQMMRLVAETPPGRQVALRLLRAGKMQSATVLTARRPADLQADVPRILPGLPPEIPAPLLVWRNTILGVECESLNSQLAGFFAVQHGILVRFVEKNSRGDFAGLRAGDVIVAAGERPIANPRDLAMVLRQQAGSGTDIRVSVLRDHKRMSLQVDAGE